MPTRSVCDECEDKVDMNKIVSQRDGNTVQFDVLRKGKSVHRGWIEVEEARCEIVGDESIPGVAYPDVVRAMLDQMDDEDVRQILLETGFKRLKDDA